VTRCWAAPGAGGALPLKPGYARTELACTWITARFGCTCAAMGAEVHEEGGQLVIAGT